MPCSQSVPRANHFLIIQRFASGETTGVFVSESMFVLLSMWCCGSNVRGCVVLCCLFLSCVLPGSDYQCQICN
jgi:hypothetical protein